MERIEKQFKSLDKSNFSSEKSTLISVTRAGIFVLLGLGLFCANEFIKTGEDYQLVAIAKLEKQNTQNIKNPTPQVKKPSQNFVKVLRVDIENSPIEKLEQIKTGENDSELYESNKIRNEHHEYLEGLLEGYHEEDPDPSDKEAYDEYWESERSEYFGIVSQAIKLYEEGYLNSEQWIKICEIIDNSSDDKFVLELKDYLESISIFYLPNLDFALNQLAKQGVSLDRMEAVLNMPANNHKEMGKKFLAAMRLLNQKNNASEL